MWHFDVNTLMLLGIAALNAYSVYISHRVEKNTDGIKDALVASTAKASLAEGEAKGLQRGRDEHSTDLPLR